MYLSGAYDDEEATARAYDLAALKYWGPGTLINFPVSMLKHLRFKLFRHNKVEEGWLQMFRATVFIIV